MGGFLTHLGRMEWGFVFEAGRALLAAHSRVLVGEWVLGLCMGVHLRQQRCFVAEMEMRKLRLELLGNLRLQGCWVQLAGVLLAAAWQAGACPKAAERAGGNEVACSEP